MSPQSRSRTLSCLEDGQIAFATAREEAAASKAAAEAAANALKEFAISKPPPTASRVASLSLKPAPTFPAADPSSTVTASDSKQSDATSTSSVSSETAPVDVPLPKESDSPADAQQSVSPRAQPETTGPSCEKIAGAHTIPTTQSGQASATEPAPPVFCATTEANMALPEQPGTSALLEINSRREVGFGSEDGIKVSALGALPDLKEKREAILAEFDSDIDSDGDNAQNSISVTTEKIEDSTPALPAINLTTTKNDEPVPSPYTVEIVEVCTMEAVKESESNYQPCHSLEAGNPYRACESAHEKSSFDLKVQPAEKPNGEEIVAAEPDSPKDKTNAKVLLQENALCDETVAADSAQPSL